MSPSGKLELIRFRGHPELGFQPEEGVLTGRPSKYSPEFREQAVELVRATGMTVAETVRDLQIHDTFGNWVKVAPARHGLSGVPLGVPATARWGGWTDQQGTSRRVSAIETAVLPVPSGATTECW
jgi:transposase